MKVYALTDIGRVRSVNQDCFYQPRPGETFAVVADGMGGHKAGEVASTMAVEEFVRWLKCAPAPDQGTLEYAVTEANRAVYQASKARSDREGMGTTLTALWQDGERIYLAHVGDSRAYRLRGGMLEQMSRDHSLVNSLLEQGLITAEEARVHPQRNYITRALGTHAAVDVDISCFESKKGDVWLLCSDGLSNYYEASELRDVLSGSGDWKGKAARLLRGALERGGSDNITLLIVLCDGGVS